MTLDDSETAECKTLNLKCKRAVGFWLALIKKAYWLSGIDAGKFALKLKFVFHLAVHL
jgi:hypothetical protein